MANTTASGCPVPEFMPEDPAPFFQNGELHFKAHQVGFIVAGSFAVIAVITSAWLIVKHLSFFHAPHTQRHIVRILLLVPIYAICSFLSYYLWHQALFFQLLRDCYEALVIGAFFFLLLAYLSTPLATPPDVVPRPLKTRAERDARLREVVHHMHLKKWMWPLGRVKWRCAGGEEGEGEAFIWLMRICIGQYVIVRPLSTIVAVAGYSFPADYYCLASWAPRHLHLWTALAITISVTVAMYAVLQLYVPFKRELSPWSPILALCAVKGVVFLTFWQESGLTWLASLGVIKSTTYWSSESIVVGMAALLSTFEMTCFAFLHIKAFPYQPYRALAPVDSDKRKKDGQCAPVQTRKWPALKKCLILSDLMRELKHETRYVVRRGRRTESEELVARDQERKRAREVLYGNGESKQGVDGDDEEVKLFGGLDGETTRLRAQKIGTDGEIVQADKGRKDENEEKESLVERRMQDGRSGAQRWTAASDSNPAWWKRSLGRAFGGRKDTSADLDSLSSSYYRLEAQGDGYHPRPPPSDVDRQFGRAAPANQPVSLPRASLPRVPCQPLNLSALPILVGPAAMPLPPPHALGPPSRLASISHTQRHSVTSVPRPASYASSVPTPSSPLPFTNLVRNLVAPPAHSPSLTEYVPSNRGSWRRHSSPVVQDLDAQSLKSLQVYATEESKRSQGLPPGAAPPARR